MDEFKIRKVDGLGYEALRIATKDGELMIEVDNDHNPFVSHITLTDLERRNLIRWLLSHPQ